MAFLFVLILLIFLILLWQLIPKPDIDRPHLVTTPSARGGLTLRGVRNALVALFMVGVILSAYLDSSESGNESRGAMLGAFIFWGGVILMFRTPTIIAESTGVGSAGNPAGSGGYQLQWGARTVTYDLRGAAERWVTRIVFWFMLINALAVVL